MISIGSSKIGAEFKSAVMEDEETYIKTNNALYDIISQSAFNRLKFDKLWIMLMPASVNLRCLMYLIPLSV